ncbi:MAG: 2-dehydropantoate 2-reductase, partial [Chloroflexi bacterium]|nr:2-dehydropantoate 2-reductase [Chloroflexota bacterium]
MTEGKNRRVIIFGAGAIGCVVGGHLSLTGTEVILVGRPGHVTAIREKGLKFIAPNGTQVLQLPAVTEPRQIEFRPEDVVFLCVKSQDTEGAMRDLHAVARGSPVFCFQNGVRNEEMASRFFSNVYAVAVRVGGIFLNDGEVIARKDPPGALVIGRYPDGTDDLVDSVASMLRKAGFFVLVSPEIMPYKWGKLMKNLPPIVTAITYAKTGIDHITDALFQEAEEIMAQAGLRWVREEEILKQVPAVHIQGRSMVVEPHSSTWQSLARGQGTTEIDYRNGEIVRLAESLG